MTAALRRKLTGSLLRAGVIAGILAIMAGIFGMHVMTGSHSLHSPVAAHTPAPTQAGASHVNHAGTDHHGEPDTSAGVPATSHGFPSAVAAEAASCACSEDCGSGQSMSGSCISSATAGTLAAPVPGPGTPASNITAALQAGAAASYTYLPGGPSPGELSISRT